MIFLDRSIPKSVANALKLVRSGDIVWLEDEFAHDTPDEVWIPAVAAKDWVVVSRDKKIRSRPWQRRLIREHGLGCFIVGQKQDLTRWDYLKLLAGCLDELERLGGETPKPFLFLIDSRGNFRRVSL